MHIEQSSNQSELVSGLAHRMNNILTLFHGYVGLLLDNNALDKGTRASLTKIKDGACAATELIDRTHALVRGSKVVTREVDLPYFLGLLRPSFEALCGPKTTFRMELGELPPMRSDSARIKSALTELVRNACEATATGGTVRVEVCAQAPSSDSELDDASGWVSIAVIDDGDGISPQVAERMFQPFFSTRKQQKSTGLGLNVVADAVQQLGGVLNHESKPGETRFSILLPVR